MKKNILIICRQQFGWHIDSLKYCEYLNEKYNISYLCFDYNRPKIKVNNVHVTYISRSGPLFLRGIRFLVAAIISCLRFKGFIFIITFPKFYYLKKILFWKRMHVDIRTLSISPNKQVREKEDKEVIKYINKFESVSFISEGIKNIIDYQNKAYILPLGADIISSCNKAFKTIKLLYVGTLENRRIIDTVKGVELFITKHPDISISYDIIGGGEEFDELLTYVTQHKLNKHITLHGRIPYNELKPFFDSCNVGVSYIPMTSYYEYQPPTKTFEYILSGLFCIATNTFSNKEIINSKNGILINDSINDFANVLYTIHKCKDQLNSKDIRQTLSSFQWEEIIDRYLIQIIEENYPTY